MSINGKQFDIAVIGAGVIGCAITRELSKYKLKVVLIEKENDVAEGISKANSGVIHAGFNVPVGSLKAKFNLQGLSMLPKLADELGVDYRICKKMVIAKDDYEKQELIRLFEQGLKNHTPGLSIIDEKAIKILEPRVRGKWALLSARTGIITPYLFTIALAENALLNGVEIRLSSRVTNISNKNNDCFRIEINKESNIYSKWIINSAGLSSDKIPKMLNEKAPEIYPCRGEYFIIDKAVKDILNMAVYPVPHKDNRGLGIHLTPTMNGNLLIGPSAEYVGSMDTSTTQKVMNNLKYEAYELLPELKDYSFIRSFSGIRPKLFNNMFKIKFADFYIKESDENPGLINLIGIESPGLTSAPAIAKHVVENIFGTKNKLVKKEKFNPKWVGIEKFIEKPLSEKRKIIRENPEFGEIICRCEEITKAEIIQAINNPLGVKTLDGIKKRTHAMMGRCQAGFCMSRIIELLINRYNVNPHDIILNKNSSKIITNLK